MTNEQINQRIAEACGWKKVHVNGDAGVYKGFDNGAELRPDIPDYCNDLNAMHDAEEVLNKTDLCVMGIWIARLLSKEAEWFHATARQRAEAFLRALGKWKEVQG